MVENARFETEFDIPKVKEFWPWHVPHFEELGFKVAPPFLFWVKTVRFQLRSKTEVLSLTKPPFWIGTENGQLCPMKEGPTLKPNYSTLELSTCQDRNFFYLGLPNSISNPTLSNV